MTNPTNLQELADSLAAQARYAEQRCREYDQAGNNVQRANQAGYANALLDTRATVLAMIADVNRRIANNNQIVGPGSITGQALLDGRIEAYEDVRGEDHAHTGGGDFCTTCGASYDEMDHAPYPCEALCPECGCVVSDHHEACTGMVVGDGPETNPNVVILSELTATIQRKRDGIDCTEDESALIKRYLRACEGSDDAVVALFPLEWAEVCAE
jgi:hypothetical protein